MIGYFPPSFSFSSEPEIYPQIVEIEPGYFQFGDLVIDRKNREFVLPALCNQTYGLIEYALVHENGKVHESLFRTSVSPRLIHACLLLLKESPQTDFFKNLQANQPNFSTLRTIEVFADWENNGSTFSEDLSALVICQKNDRLLRKNSFVFTGSRLIEGIYLAEEDGSIVAVYHDNRATINSLDEESNLDDVWLANEGKMPPKEFPVSIRFRLPSKK